MDAFTTLIRVDAGVFGSRTSPGGTWISFELFLFGGLTLWTIY